MLTLIEAAKTAPDLLTEGVMELFASSSPVLENISFDDVQGGGLKYSQEDTLPGVGFRGVNESWTPSTGVINPEFEPLVIAGGELDVDLHILRTQGEGQRATQTRMKVKALALKWTQVFFKGDSVTNPRQFDGLQVRLVGSQSVTAGSTASGAALSLMMLDDLIGGVEGDNKVLYLNQKLANRLSAALRNVSIAGYVQQTVDSFGNPLQAYNGVPIRVIGTDNLRQEILPFTEAASGGGSNLATSIYCVSFSDETIHGIQSPGGMIVTDLGELGSDPVKRTRVEWDNGFVVRHPFAAKRLHSIGDLAVVA